MIFDFKKYKVFFLFLNFLLLIIILLSLHYKLQLKFINIFSKYNKIQEKKFVTILEEQQLDESVTDYEYVDNEENIIHNQTADDFSQDKNINKYDDYEDYTNSITRLPKFISAKNSETSKININKHLSDVQTIVFNETGHLKNRLQKFNEYLSNIRFKLLQRRGFKEWTDVSKPNKLKVIWGNTENFLQRLAESDNNVLNILLPWHTPAPTQKISGLNERQKLWNGWDSRYDFTNIFINQYHTWTGSEQLCEWIVRPGFTKAHWDAVYNRTCSFYINDSISDESIEFVYFHGKPINIAHYYPNNGLNYPNYFYKQPPRSIFYLSIFPDAIINLNGDVIFGEVKAVPYTCSHDNIPTIPNEYRETNIFSEVFVITQFWGSSYFHFIIEVLPRLSPFLDFLLNNSEIFVHSPLGDRGGKMAEFFEILGIKKERIVTGVVRAKTLYLPHATPCGFALVHEFQLLSQYYRSYIKESLFSNGRNRLILIKRSGIRKFLMHSSIESDLKYFCRENNLLFTSFEDHPSPSLKVTMKMFNEAAIIVGPHGAGLSNIIFAEPNTLIVEGVCNPPHVNMCYQRIAHILGHYYHGISSIDGCESFINIIPERINVALNQYMPIIRKHFNI